MTLKESVIEALKHCQDPELGMDIWTLELVYDVDISEGNVNIRMTLTSPMCPYGPQMVEEVKQKVGEIEGVKSVNIELVFEPPWKPSEELRAMMGV